MCATPLLSRIYVYLYTYDSLLYSKVVEGLRNSLFIIIERISTKVRSILVISFIHLRLNINGSNVFIQKTKQKNDFEEDIQCEVC